MSTFFNFVHFENFYTIYMVISSLRTGKLYLSVYIVYKVNHTLLKTLTIFKVCSYTELLNIPTIKL